MATWIERRDREWSRQFRLHNPPIRRRKSKPFRWPNAIPFPPPQVNSPWWPIKGVNYPKYLVYAWVIGREPHHLWVPMTIAFEALMQDSTARHFFGWTNWENVQNRACQLMELHESIVKGMP